MSSKTNNSKTTIFSKADKKLKLTLKNVKNYNESNLLKITHKWCANMRLGKGSKSLSTASIPLTNKQNKKKLFLPISVCCSTDYC